MLRATKDLPAVQKMLATAADILGYDLLQARSPPPQHAAFPRWRSDTPTDTGHRRTQVCLEGPEDKLGDTAFAQPAIFLGSLAAAERLRSDEPALVASVSAAAGLSLGEYSALVFAGAMSFEEGLRVVRVRAESMAAAAKARASAAALRRGLQESYVFPPVNAWQRVRFLFFCTAAQAGDQGMLAVVGLDDQALGECITEALKPSPDG